MTWTIVTCYLSWSKKCVPVIERFGHETWSIREKRQLKSDG